MYQNENCAKVQAGTSSGVRAKPVVPAKPTNIPPPQKYAAVPTAGRPKLPSDGATAVPTSSVPNSPNMSFVNDCCGMLLSSKTPPPPHCIRNSNNNNCSSAKSPPSSSSSSCSTPQNSCCCSSLISAAAGAPAASTTTIIPVLGCSQKPPPSVSSMSSHSGGFRDKDAASDSPKQPAESTKMQFTQTSKQIEQILAQRLGQFEAGGPNANKKRSMSCSSNNNHKPAASLPPAASLLGQSAPGMSKSYHASTSLDSSSLDLADAAKACLQGKLQQEMKKHCRLIQEKHLIERRPPQKHYKAVENDDWITTTLTTANTNTNTITNSAKPNHCQSVKESQMVLPQTTPPTTQSATAKLSSAGKGYAPQPPTAATPAPDTTTLVYRDGNLISGLLDSLIQHMIPTDEYYPDNSYVFAFILSARLFIRPHELLARICEMWEAQQEQLLQLVACVDVDVCDDAKGMPPSIAAVDNALTRRAQKNAQNFTKLLAEWIDTFPYDFRDERLMQHVRTITRKCVAIDAGLGKEISRMLQGFMNRLTVLEKYEEFLQAEGGVERTQSTSSANADEANGLHSSSSGNQSDSSANNSLTNFPTDSEILEMGQSPANLAHQLTHIELERLSHIGPEEFVQAFAKQNRHLESFSDMKKTRNLESYVQWFNRLSYLVATEIVKHSKKKQRARVVEFWIETARECFNIGNFNSLMAIIAGLNMSPISRLKKTWAKVQPAKFSVLEHQMDPTSNFNSYRSTLKAAMWRSAGATDERERIIIPFFSLLVKDLYFLNEGCSNKLPNGHINFEKFWQLAKQVQEFNTWKKVTCPFDKSQKIIMFLQTSPVLNETTLSLASFECEPPENTQEKDRYKTLKSESKQLQLSQSHSQSQSQP